MRLLFVISLMFISLFVFSQEKEPKDMKGFKHYLGFNLGTLNGPGFSYKYHLGKVGLQLTALPPVGEDYKSSYGVSTHYRIHTADKTNLFVQAGFNFNNLFDKEMKNAGVGLGAEFGKGDISFCVTINYEVYDLDDSKFPFLGTDLGLFYRF